MAIDQLGRDSVEQSRQQLGYSQQLTQELGQQQTLAAQLNATYGNSVSEVKRISEEFKTARNEASELSEAIKEQLEALKKTNEFSSRYADLNEKIKKAGKEFNDNRTKSIDLESNLGSQAQKLAQQYVDGLTARYKIDEKINELAEKKFAYEDTLRNTTNPDLIRQAREEYFQAGLIVKKLKDQLEVVSQINEGEGNLLSNLSEEEKIQLQQFAILQKQMDVSRNIVRNHQNELDILTKQLTPWQKIVSYAMLYVDKLKEFPGVKASLDFITTQLNTIGISFQAILKNVLALDKTLTDFGKSVQVSKEGARAIASSFEEASFRASEFNSNVSSAQASIRNQIEANNELNTSLGTGARFTIQSRMDQIEIVKGMGLQAEVGSKLYQLGKLNGMTAHQTAAAIGDQVVNIRKATGITLDYRKILTDVSKVSGQLAVQYKNNPELIAQAVTQAHLLGLELQQTAKMGSSLVDDFAGSLGRELEAELLTGKRLNLEQARYLALMGDSAGAAKELMDNVGGIEEFQRLNVLQQKSLASAIGLSTDELSDALFKQEQLKGTSFETAAAFEETARAAARTGDYTKLNAELARAANGEELTKQASQISNQEKFQMAIEKLQETLANMVNGPLGLMIDKIATLTSKAGFLKTVMAGIAAIISINIVGGLISVGKGIAAVIPKFAALAAEATFMNSLLTFGLGLAVAAAAAGIGYSIINSLSDGEANVSGAGGGGGGISIPNSGARGDKNININLVNENTTYVGGQKMSQFNTESQKTINTRVS
jgi:hypothetical protein